MSQHEQLSKAIRRYIVYPFGIVTVSFAVAMLANTALSVWWSLGVMMNG